MDAANASFAAAGVALLPAVAEGPLCRVLAAALQAGEVVEDWEVWGDPREVERRKAERARAAQPPEQRRVQVVTEWATARAAAAVAKSAGDKAKQKSVGQIIRGLKQEMQQLGEGGHAAIVGAHSLLAQVLVCSMRTSTL